MGLEGESPLEISSCYACHLSECEISRDRWNLYTKWKQTEDWLADKTFHERWKSFDCLCYNPNDRLVYAGLTATNGDFFYTFDPFTKTFQSLHFPVQGDRYAHKIHAGLTMDHHNRLWGAIATLSDVDIWPHAPGGKIFHFDPQTKNYSFFSIPFPHDYIQGIVVDETRGVVYGNTFPGRMLFKLNVSSGEVHPITMYGATLSEKILKDAGGCIWHNYHLAQWANRTPLFRYHPDSDRIEFLNIDLPNVLGTGTSIIDSCLVTRDGDIYLGGSDGSLSRLDPQVPAIHHLGKPISSPRMKGLLESSDGLIYAAVGNQYDTYLCTFNKTSSKFDIIGEVKDTQDGTRSWMTHDLCLIDDNVLVAAETDNPHRSSCLYVIYLKK
jgi:streptogramin lyase